MRFLTAGDRALLVELDRPPADAVAGVPQDPEPARLYRTLMLRRLPGVVEFVPAARTVLVRFDPDVTTPAQLADRIGEAARKAAGETGDTRDADDAPALEIPVHYDGADLGDVARLAGLSAAEVIARHCAPVYTVAFCGFAPGFAYLTGLDRALRLPRRAVPRTSVPAGSVAIADRYTAVYPHSSPGGWQLLGRTDAVVWDHEREPPAILTAGTRVRFVPARRARGHAGGRT